MIPVGFDYVRAESVEAATSLLRARGDEAKLLAGGHSLVPLLKLRLAAPSLLIDVTGLASLRYVRDEGSRLAIGALTRYRELQRDRLLREHAPLLAHVAGVIGDPQVRNHGTIGGSLAHGDPASDLPAAALCLGATLVVEGPGGVRRDVSADDFFQGFLTTALQPDEMLVEIRVPKRAGRGWSYQKLNRRAQDYAIVAAAVSLGPSGARVSLVNMGMTPLRALAVEQALARGRPDEEAARAAGEGTEPVADANADRSYRRHLARALVARGLREARARSAAGELPGL